MPDWQAHRQFPRYLIRLPLLHKAIAPASAKAGVGWTRDLSEGGACVELAERLPPQSVLHLILRTDRGSIELEGKVAWAGESSGAGEGVLHGLTFIRIAAEQLQALQDLIVSKGCVRSADVRLPLQLPVTCRPKDGSGPPFAGSTGDISRSGLLLLLPKVLSARSSLAITLHTPNGRLDAEGEVVWVEPSEGRVAGRPVRHGFRFTCLGWSDSLSLGLFLAQAA